MDEKFILKNILENFLKIWDSFEKPLNLEDLFIKERDNFENFFELIRNRLNDLLEDEDIDLKNFCEEILKYFEHLYSCFEINEKYIKQREILENTKDQLLAVCKKENLSSSSDYKFVKNCKF